MREITPNRDIYPISLKCENLSEPIGIDNPRPEFSWHLVSSEKNKVQSAWRIIVSSTRELAHQGVGDMWDSSKVSSDQQSGISYAGRSLSPTERYWWRVMVWDEEDNCSGWSDTSSFVTGFFSLTDWNSRWLDAQDDAVFARKEFLVDETKTVKHAFLYAAAVGSFCNSFELHLNGEVIGDEVLFPGPTEHFRAIYRGHDVTRKLRPGFNAIGLIYTRKTSLILIIKYTDGSSIRIVVDDTWKIKAKGPFVSLPDLKGFTAGRKEVYDARFEPINWDMAGYEDYDWTNYQWKGWWTGPLYLSAGLEGCKIMQRFKPVSITKKESKSYLVDFGRNMSGFVSIAAEGPEGTEIVIRYAERVDDDGNIDPTTYTYIDPEYSNTFILKGEGKEYYRPTFMYTSFRYVEITSYPGKLKEDDIEACFIYTSVTDGSYFVCSNEEINKLQSCAVNSFLSNLVNIPTDCPGRERRGWTADAFAVSEAECINFDMLNVFYRWFNDLSDCQLNNGWIPVEFPRSTVEAVDVIWPCASVLIPWDIYKIYGDQAFLKKYYKNMVAYVEFLTSIAVYDCIFNPDINISFGDWVAKESASKCFIASIYYYACVKRLSKIAWVLGIPEDKDRYVELALKVKNQINDIYLKGDGTSYYYDNNSQSANAHALYFEIVPEDKKEAVVKSLVEKIEQDGTNTTGFLGTMCILQALASNGRNDIAYSLVRNKKSGGWLYMVEKNNLTTFAEDYDIETFPERYIIPASLNHAFLGGSLSAWLYKHLVGITPVKPGYKKISIKPFVPDDVEFAKAQVATVHGNVYAEWKKEDNNFILNVEIPVNTTANIYIPSADQHSISEIEDNIISSRKLEMEDNKDGYYVLKVGSGTYTFKSRLK